MDAMLEALDGPTPEPGPREPSEDDLRRFVGRLAETSPGPILLTFLEPGDQGHLDLGCLRLDSAGYLCDRVTGGEVIPLGGAAVSFRGCHVERTVPDHYRIRTTTNGTILLRYTHGGWYYRQEP